MTQEEIIKDVLKFLTFIRNSDAYMGQDPYKSDLFKLFKETYKNGYFEHSSSPLLTGDSLCEILVTRWVADDEEENERRLALIQKLNPMWNEWRYAWDKYDL